MPEFFIFSQSIHKMFYSLSLSSMTYFLLLFATGEISLNSILSTSSPLQCNTCHMYCQLQSLDLPLDKLARETYQSINSRATLIDSVAYLLAYGKTLKNTACACYSKSAIIRISTVCHFRAQTLKQKLFSISQGST